MTWPQVLAWRLERQLLVPRRNPTAAEVAGRLGGVQAQVASSAALGVAVRQAEPDPGETDRALWVERSLVRTWTVRGTLHLVAAADLPVHTASLSTFEVWRSAAWERYHGVSAAEVEQVCAAIPEVLDGGADGSRVLTREQLGAELTDRLNAPHLAGALSSGWAAVLKQAARKGLLCQGPPSDGRVTFVRPDQWLARWPAVDPDEAALSMLRVYLGAHGPTSRATYGRWWGHQRTGPVTRWFRMVADETVTVSVEGQELVMLAADVESLAGTGPGDAVRLLPGFDQYVLAAARDIEQLVPTALRPRVFRAAGWVSPVVVSGGRVVGVWDYERDTGTLSVDLAEPVADPALGAETDRLAAWFGRPDGVSVQVTTT